MDSKHRSFPPQIPVKLSKLFEYQYLADIYRKYDCNFFREILPYFSQISTTNTLDIFKFLYLPIQNPRKVQGIKIGTPFKLQVEIKNPNFYELSHEVTFIKIAYQTHVIFEYLMKLNLTNVSIPRFKFQDKFWLFSEGVLNHFNFGEVAYRLDSRTQKGLIILLQGEFKCFNEEKKPFKTIGKGYLIDLQGKLKKVRFDQKVSTGKLNLDQSAIVSTHREAECSKEQKDEEKISALWSNSNTAKALFISLEVIKKYYPEFEDKTYKNSPRKQSIYKIKNILKPEFRSQLQILKKTHRPKTQNEQIFDYSVRQKSVDTKIDFPTPVKKFNIVSCRTSTSVCSQLPLIPIDEIFNNDVIKSYTKDKDLYKNMLRQKSQRKKRHRKFYSNDERDFLCDRKEQLMPFFKQELKEDKEKVILKRRKTKQMWGRHSGTEKENFLVDVKKIVDDLKKEKDMNQKEKKLMKKVAKTEIAAFQLLKRNMFNKQYHKSNFAQMQI